jgi:Na+/glutamate symporter
MIPSSWMVLVLPSVLLRPVNSSSKFADRYRGIPSSLALVIAAVASFGLAVISGILGGVAGTFLYDRANSKEDEFTLVVVFTWVEKVHHPIRRAPVFSRWIPA